MQRHGKVYGFTIAIWEFGNTVQSLAWKISNHYNIDPALRPMMRAFLDRKVPAAVAWILFYLGGSRTHGFARSGFKWSMCHFWSNFEIADLDWFRGNEYEEFFNIIDKDGGIYYERVRAANLAMPGFPASADVPQWGDASIHSLAVGLFLKPEQVHYFGDNIGYRHDVFMCCPADAPTGCKCDCRSKTDATVPSHDCLNAYKRAVRWSLEPPTAISRPDSSAVRAANLSRDETHPNW
jgi:mannosyltransferase